MQLHARTQAERASAMQEATAAQDALRGGGGGGAAPGGGGTRVASEP